jgi:hypothetical protein
VIDRPIGQEAACRQARVARTDDDGSDAFDG